MVHFKEVRKDSSQVGQIHESDTFCNLSVNLDDKVNTLDDIWISELLLSVLIGDVKNLNPVLVDILKDVDDKLLLNHWTVLHADHMADTCIDHELLMMLKILQVLWECSD